jgi:GNAT superfamily N-acetyltransferase
MNINKETRLLRSIDAKNLANLHIRAFPNFFLTTLGERFLKTFYESILNSSEGFGVALFEEDCLLGFAIGTEQTHGFYRDLVSQNGLNLFFSSLFSLVRNPMKIIRIIKNLKGGNNSYQLNEGGWLLSICTNPEHWGKGISAVVLKSFEEEATKRSLKKIWLTTDFGENERANSFYLKMNYNLFMTFVNSNKRHMNLYVKELNNI